MMTGGTGEPVQNLQFRGEEREEGEVGKAQAHSQLGEREEGLDIKGWAGQLPAPKARWPLSGQAKHSQDNGVSCSRSGRQESLPSQGPACYMTKGGTYKEVRPPLIKAESLSCPVPCL